VAYIGVGFLGLIIVLAVAFLVWRFAHGGPMEAGGSLGRQLFGKDRDDWGPKAS
jgi:hypothetical protein